MDDLFNDTPERPSFSRAQKWSIAFHVFLSVLACLAIAAMLNYLAHRHNARFYLSKASAHKLSPLTLQVLTGLTNDLKIIVFFDRREPLFGTVASMIKEYQARSPKIDVEFVDYRMPGRAEAIRAKYKLDVSGDNSRIIFDSGTQVRTVLGSELSDFKIEPNQEIRRTGFKGEQLFTTAIMNVTRSKPVTAYFTQGHGEHDPFAENDDRGYSRFARLLESNHIQPKSLPPIIGSSIPEDCGLLIIAGPERHFDQEEITKIEKYLNQGGRLLILFSFSGMSVLTGLEQILWKWNVEVGFNWVQDISQAQAGEKGVIVTDEFGAHLIVRPLLRSSLKIVAPRSIGQRQGAATAANAPKVAELFFTGEDGRAIVPPREGNLWTVQRTGRIPLAVALERGGIQGVATEGSSARVVVCGDSLFLSNLAYNQAANSDFGNLAVNWLINRDAFLAEIGPSPVSEYQILLTTTEMVQLRWLFLAVIPGCVMVFGIFVWLRRRS